MGQPFNQPTHQPIHQSTHQAIHQPTHQAANQAAHQAIDQALNQPVRQPLAPSFSQPGDPPLDQLGALQGWLEARLARLEGEGAFEEAYALRMEMADWLLAEAGSPPAGQA
jgi:hypothetical protein